MLCVTSNVMRNSEKNVVYAISSPQALSFCFRQCQNTARSSKGRANCQSRCLNSHCSWLHTCTHIPIHTQACTHKLHAHISTVPPHMCSHMPCMHAYTWVITYMHANHMPYTSTGILIWMVTHNAKNKCHIQVHIIPTYTNMHACILHIHTHTAHVHTHLLAK